MKELIEFNSSGSRLHGVFYPGGGETPRQTALLVRGFPPEEGDSIFGQRLAVGGINAMIFWHRGTGQSEGTFSLKHAQEDIHAALDFLGTGSVIEKYKIDTDRLLLGGISFGGGMALSYAAAHPSVRRVFTLAGDDHGEVKRHHQRDPAYAEGMDAYLASLNYPDGPIHFENDRLMDEIIQDPTPYDLRLNAAALADRDILLIGGWDDAVVTFEDKILPVYRALKAAGADSVKITAVQDDHSFEHSINELAEIIITWIKKGQQTKK
ncbi:alpha/beta hydrolase [Chloroflexota bacterium]